MKLPIFETVASDKIIELESKIAELEESNDLMIAASMRMNELEKQNAELVKERDELNKQCGEFQDGFFEYMGLSDHLQIEVDNLKKKIVNLITPDTSKKTEVN